MTRARLLAAAALLASGWGCQDPPELTLRFRLPDDRRLFQAVAQLNMTATRDGVVLAQSSFSSMTGSVSLSRVSHGPRTVITLDGVDTGGEIIARGRTCPINFDSSGQSAPLYFAPTNFFAPTAGDPATLRHQAMGSALGDGTVLIAGGLGDADVVLPSSEQFSAATARFSSHPVNLIHARYRSESVYLSGIGLLLTGGLDQDGRALADAELYDESRGVFSPLADPRLDARVGHRVVLLSDGRAFISGGSGAADGPPLATTLFLFVGADGTYQVSPGPPLAEARRAHAATVAIGAPMVFGGYGTAGEPLASIEALDPLAGPGAAASAIARLNIARAEATASALPDGSILLVGGVGPARRLQATAELFNPVTRLTTLFYLAFPRRGHTATVLSDGRVLIAGGVDDDGGAIAAVELFAPGIGFVTERALGTPRAGHLAVPLCDGTVLLVGGGAGAEVYSGAAN